MQAWHGAAITMAPLSILKFTPLGKLHLTQRAPSRMAQRSFARKQSVTQEVPRIKEVAATPPPPVSLASPLVVQTFYRRTGDRFLRPHFPFSTLQDKEIWALFFPALLALLLEPVQALIDTAIVGHLGVAELGAVGFGTLIFQFALGFFASLIFATTPLVASHAANKDLPGVSGQHYGMRTALFHPLMLLPPAIQYLLCCRLLEQQLMACG